jgi:hypothetical protein
MAENDKTDLAAGAPALDIPDLKKKEEEERKRGGAALSSGKPGTGFTGAVGGNGAAGARAAASSAAARAAAGEALGSSGILGALAALTSTLIGKVFVAAAVALVLSLAAVLAYKLRPAGAVSGGPGLAGVGSGLKVRKGGGDRTFAYSGLLAWVRGSGADEKSPTQSKEDVPAAPQAQAAAKGGEPAGSGRGASGPGDRLAHDLSGAKLSTELGGSAGGKSLPSESNGGMLSSGFDLSKIAGMDSTAAQQGKLSKMSSGVRATVSGRRSVSGARSQRAIGQLKLARNLTSGMAGTTQEGARTMAADAFDGSKTNGGVLNTPSPGSSGAPVSLNSPGASGGSGGSGGGGFSGESGASGAPGVYTNPADLKGTLSDIPSETEAAPGKDVTDWAGPVTTALDMAQKAYEMNNQSTILFGLGAAATVAAIALLATGVSAPAAAVAFAAAAALVASATVLRQQAIQTKEQATALGRQIKDLYGQEYQKKIIDECLEQALAGTKPAECDPATKPDPKSTAAEDIKKEAESTYTKEPEQEGDRQ